MKEPTNVPRPFWPPLVAGVALGVTVLFTFLLTGNGLGASGAFARTAAWLGGESAKTNAYLGAFWQNGHPLNNWIDWVVVGVFLGALLSAVNSGRFRWKLEGAAAIGTGQRIATAFLGGVLAGFGSRIAAGCTSGLGLSGGATLAVSAFVFLALFFVTGIVVSRMMPKGE
ncbi:YeeE/YedE thiosulfate transporter family protein [Hydrogenophilus thiooxidans]|uniref:YeeE/YedE thiosulfate transporter family protein n=1 Tax=Hydrogenophilus thiooxidans TaxID=2820326 RepID=UPI001C22A616|nr:YeeE/YedE thiosulfate transporter family protein [Hydrogenophilus thiooxidans]